MSRNVTELELLGSQVTFTVILLRVYEYGFIDWTWWKKVLESKEWARYRNGWCEVDMRNKGFSEFSSLFGLSFQSFCFVHGMWTGLTSLISLPSLSLQLCNCKLLCYTHLFYFQEKKKKKKTKNQKKKRKKRYYLEITFFFLIFLFYKLLYGLIVWSRQVVGSGEYQFHIILLLRPIFIYNMSLLKKKKYLYH